MAQADYLEFELQIGPGSGRDYPVTVLGSPAGQGQDTLRFPFSDQILASHLEDLQAALSGAGGWRRGKQPARGPAGEVFGQALFDALFRGEVGSLYDKSWRQAAEQGKVLRLELRLQSPELVALPWEYLYDARLREYLCLSHTSIVRYLEPSQAGQPPAVTPPLRILGMIAGAGELPLSALEDEKRRLEEATTHLQSLELVKLGWVKGQTWSHLLQTIGTDEWDVFYFVGDGGLDPDTGEGFVVLAAEGDGSEHLSVTRLGRLLASRESLRLVWLNSAAGTAGDVRDRFFSTASQLVQRGIPAVLNMQLEMPSPAAVTFAEALYAALASTLPLDLAVAKARMALRAESTGTLEWGIPVLHTNSPDLRLFDRETLGETACQRGDEALASDDFQRAITQYTLAAEMGAVVNDEQRALAEKALRTTRQAEELLSWGDDNVETLADEILQVDKDLENLEQRLPGSKAIRHMRIRVRERASGLRDRLWQDGQQMMRRRTIGLTLAGQSRQMLDSVHLLQKATLLDKEDNPAIREDLARATRRLQYLENAQVQARGKQGRRRRRIAILGAVILVVLLLACLAAAVAGAPSLVGFIETASTGAAATASQMADARQTTSAGHTVTASQTVAADQTAAAYLSLTGVAATTQAATVIPSPSHTAQPTLPSTAAATTSPAPSSTVAPTVRPSSTPRPTATQRRTETPTLPPTGTATDAPEPAAAEPGTPTPSATFSPTPSPVPEIVYPAPGLLQPDDVVFLSQEGDARYPMRWTWDGTLQADEWFDVRIWPSGSPHYGVAWTKEPEYLYDICLKGNGHFYWTIAVVRGQGGEWIGDLSPEASPRLFSSSRSNEWCLQNGRWVQDRTQ